MAAVGRLPLLLTFVAIAVVAVGAWLVVSEPDPPIRLGEAGSADPTEPWWLTVTVVEGKESEPVTDTTLTFLLRLVGRPHDVVSVERTTDAYGRARIGPIVAPLAEAQLELAALSDRYDVAKVPARAEIDPSEGRTLRATCEVVRISIVSGRVELPPGVSAAEVAVWRWLVRDWWVPVAIDASGRFTHRGYGAGPVALEAAAVGQGRRWYGRTQVEEGARDVFLALTDVRPGDPALLRVRVVDPDDAPAIGLVTLSLEDMGTHVSSVRGLVGRRISGTGTIAFVYEPSGTIEIEVTGIAPAGLGTEVVRGIGMDQTEVTVRLPLDRESPPRGGLGTDRHTASRPLGRPSLSGQFPPDLLVRVLDWKFEDRGAWACLVRGGSIVRNTRLDADGVARFSHLSHLPDVEDLQIWIAGLGGGRFVWVQEMEPGTDEIEVRPEVGATVRGTVRFPGGIVPERWFVHAPGPAISQRSFDAGAFEVRQEGATFEVLGVPPGTWEFSLGHGPDDAFEWVFFEARAGEHVRVDVQAE